jgi:hypothetical protein
VVLQPTDDRTCVHARVVLQPLRNLSSFLRSLYNPRDSHGLQAVRTRPSGLKTPANPLRAEECRGGSPRTPGRAYTPEWSYNLSGACHPFSEACHPEDSWREQGIIDLRDLTPC